jgi:dTMP kinase
MLITFEGLDFSGKSTQAKLLVDKLQRVLGGKGLNAVVHLIREPGGTKISERIRELLLDSSHHELSNEAELLLFSASRAQLVREVILPALKRGETVVCDRFHDSTTAYQGYGRGLDLQVIHSIHRLTTGGVTPDLTILIDLPLDEIEQRKAVAGLADDRMEGSGKEFYGLVRKGYLELAGLEPDRIAVVDGTPPVEDVARSVWELVEPRLNQPDVRYHERGVRSKR